MVVTPKSKVFQEYFPSCILGHVQLYEHIIIRIELGVSWDKTILCSMLFANPVSSKHGKIMDMLIKSKLITAAQFETKKTHGRNDARKLIGMWVINPSKHNQVSYCILVKS